VTLPAPVVEEHGGVLVVRDDLLPGGTKMRAILPLIERTPAGEFVYPSPAYGYAQVALAHCARMTGRAATVFTAKRATPHPLTRAAHDAGAKVVMVPYGYLSNVRAKARAYAEKTGAALVPFGVEDEAAKEAIAAAASGLGLRPREVWTVAGSGVLSRALQRAWPDAEFHAVVIGKEGSDIGRARRWRSPYRFEQACKPAERPPFPSSPWYDAKAWRFIARHAGPGALFWNVGR
jgi:hypothetical protein